MQPALTSPDETAGTRTGALRPRVLLIAPSLEILGGQAVQAARLLRELKNEPGIFIDFQPISPPLPFWLRRVLYLRTVIAVVIYLVQLLWRVRQYDVIHTFTAGMTSFSLWTVPAIYISRMYGKKIIINYRDGRIEQHLKSSPGALDHLRAATTIISPSEYVVDVLAERGVPARRIYNIIDVSKFRFRLRRKVQPLFLANRSLEPLYNVGCILRSFAIIQKKYPEARLTIANDGPCRPELEALAKELQLRNTDFIGAVPHSKIPDLYDTADIYLTSPNLDCMPGSLLECFASGLPVVATRAGGIPYIITHERTGLLVDLDDHESMAKCALRLLENPEFAEQVARAAYAELRQYDWEKIRNEWLDVYFELAQTATA